MKSDFKKWLKRKRIGVLYGGWSAEREVSLNSGRNVIESLKNCGYKVIPVDVHRNILDKLKSLRLDIAFIALHGPFGEDGKIQSALEILGIPYTGSNALSSMIAMNKIVSKKMFQWHKIPTPEWIQISKQGFKSLKVQKGKRAKRQFPLVVKPSTQGSAIGVSIVEKYSQLGPAIRLACKYDDEVIIEKYLPGKELTVGILQDEILPVIEIVPEFSDFYDYKAKYAAGGSKHIIPARLDKKLYGSVQSIAGKAFNALGCSGAARVDVKLDDKGNPFVLEVNTIPGMTSTSLLPDAAREAGYSFDDLILKIIEIAGVKSEG